MVFHLFRRILAGAPGLERPKVRGDSTILPVLHLLTGIGLILAVSLRDPLRDTLEFRKFAWGSRVGMLPMLLLPLLRVVSLPATSHAGPTRRCWPRSRYSSCSGPRVRTTGSDARVNLGPFQPVELIKILIVFFLAGYFAHKWEWLRDLRTRRLRWLNLPRLAQYAAGDVRIIAIPLGIFFLLKDLGPALVTGFLFW